MSGSRFALDYVYIASESEELRNVHVEMCPDDEGKYFIIDLTSADEMDREDLDTVINALWAEQFAKLKIHPVDDCRIVLTAAGTTQDVLVTVNASKIMITELRTKGRQAMYSVSLDAMKKEFRLKSLTDWIDLSEKFLVYAEVNRPALQLAGFYDYFDADRLQIIGIVEYTYLQTLAPEARHETIKRLFEHNISGLVFCRGLSPFPEMYDYAREFDVPMLQYPDSTTDFIGEIIRWLKVELAPRVTMHGVLVDIYGEGVLITGESGIGKSETALELVKRGHRLVADDAVEIKRVSHQTLIGNSPENIRYFIELRGIGIIDIRQMFGVQSVKSTQSIDMVIKLEAWDKDTVYDRLGLIDEYMDILGNSVVCHAIPIRPGRNIAIICEAAAINHRQKKMGYNAASALTERMMRNMHRKL